MSVGIDLNDDEFNEGESKGAINGGKAGLVENLSFVKVTKKGKDDHEKAPDYKVFFKDENGVELDMPFYYLDPSLEWFPKAKKTQGAAMKSLITTMIDPEYNEWAFASYKAMLDTCMKMLKDADTEPLYRIATNYGTSMSHKAFIQFRTWTPFIESMEVPMAESKKGLRPSSIEMLTGLEADEDGSGNSHSSTQPPAGAAAAEEDDWD